MGRRGRAPVLQGNYLFKIDGLRRASPHRTYVHLLPVAQCGLESDTMKATLHFARKLFLAKKAFAAFILIRVDERLGCVLSSDICGM